MGKPVAELSIEEQRRHQDYCGNSPRLAVTTMRFELVRQRRTPVIVGRTCIANAVIRRLLEKYRPPSVAGARRRDSTQARAKREYPVAAMTREPYWSGCRREP